MDLQMFAQLVVNGLLMGGVFALVSSGLAFIHGPVDLINFAHGDFVMVGMFTAFTIGVGLGLGLGWQLVLMLPVMGLLGILTYKLLIRPVLKAPPLAQALATYGLGIFLQAMALYFFGPNYKTIASSSVAGTFTFGGVIFSGPRVAAGIGCLLTFLALYLFLKKTQTGRAVHAIAQNKMGAQLVGIDLEKMYTLSFAISGICTGIAGVLAAQFLYIYPQGGMALFLYAFVCMVIGGFGSVPGALVGGLIVGLTQSLAGFYVSTAFKDVIIFLLFVALMVFRPKGLFGW